VASRGDSRSCRNWCRFGDQRSSRAKKASALSAVVVRFLRNRKRDERQGILVEQRALDTSQQSCLADEQARAHRRDREDESRTSHAGQSSNGGRPLNRRS
jgi:hypothetical protein